MRDSSLCSAQLNRPWEINSNCGGARGRERGKGCLPASLANGHSDALRVARWLRRRGAGESGDDDPADQVDGAVVEAEEAHAETQALQREDMDKSTL